MSNHLKTAHEWGVQQALAKVGYKTAEDVRKEAEELGILEQPKPAANAMADLFRNARK